MIVGCVGMKSNYLLIMFTIIINYHHLLLFIYCVDNNNVDVRSPYYQYLPDCLHENYPILTKQTTKKGLVCPMIKNEIGFLSEWTAYYEMQGFDHIIFYDNNSTSSLSELDPWVATGFVTIIKDWWIHDKRIFNIKKYKYFDMMKIKMIAGIFIHLQYVCICLYVYLVLCMFVCTNGYNKHVFFITYL